MNVSIPDCFMVSFIAGLIFGLVYEAIRVIRLILRFRWAVFICDIAFFILAAMFICKFSEFLGSYVRMYTVFGFGAGVFSYIATIGRFFNALESAASSVWRMTLGKLFRKAASGMHVIYNKISRKFAVFFGKIHEYSDNRAKIRSEHLHLKHKRLYNDMGNNIIGEGEKNHVIKATVRKSS